MVHTVTEVKKRKMVGILRDDRIATLKMFLKKIPQEKVKEVCIDMKESLRKVAEEVFPEAKVVVDHFHNLICILQNLHAPEKCHPNVTLPTFLDFQYILSLFSFFL